MSKPSSLLFSVVICILLTMAVIGCRSAYRDTSTVAEQKAAKVANQKGNELYKEYLVAETNQVGAILNEMMQIGETAKFSESQRAQWLFMTYTRLYAFEKRRGDQKLANTYFENGRYWFRRMHEIAKDTKENTDAALATYTPERCILFVDNWDKDHSDGNGAFYLHQ